MNQQPYIRIPVSPPADVRYAHTLGRGRLIPEQIDELLRPINPAFVETKQNKAFLAQHQARAEMNRIFGYGNWSSRVVVMDLMYEERITAGHPSFPKNPKGEVYWISGYQASVEVEVRDLWGMPVTSFVEWHAEENAPLPNRGEARAFAMTSVESYALRRALIGLGDRLGLGLYSKGSMDVHGGYTIQNQPGILFNYSRPPAEGQQPQQPVQQPQQQPQQAQPQQQQPQQQPQAQQVPPQQGGLQPSPSMEGFHAAQQQVQQGNAASKAQGVQENAVASSMVNRIQGGMKLDPNSGGAGAGEV